MLTVLINIIIISTWNANADPNISTPTVAGWYNGMFIVLGIIHLVLSIILTVDILWTPSKVRSSDLSLYFLYRFWMTTCFLFYYFILFYFILLYYFILFYLFYYFFFCCCCLSLFKKKNRENYKILKLS